GVSWRLDHRGSGTGLASVHPGGARNTRAHAGGRRRWRSGDHSAGCPAVNAMTRAPLPAVTAVVPFSHRTIPMNLLKLGALALALALATPAVAQETRPFTAANGTFDIPTAPQRIVALNDQIVALP